ELRPAGQYAQSRRARMLAARLPAAYPLPRRIGHPGVLEVVAEQLPGIEKQEPEVVTARPLHYDRIGLLVDPAAEVRPGGHARAAVMEPQRVTAGKHRDEHGDGLR